MVKTRLKIFLGIFIPILSFFLMSQNTFADWVQQSSTYVDSRSYIVKTNPDQSNNVITDNSFGNRNIPFNALTYISGEYRYLHEIVTYNAITDNSTDKFKSLMVDITFKSKRVQNPQSFGMTVITNRGNQYGGCVVNETGSDYIQFRCLANLQDNSTVTGVYVRIGEKTLPSTPICILNDYYDSNCQLSYMSINLTTTQDPAVSLLQQQLERQQQLINQNQTIINQNQTTINQNQQMLDNWDDEKSENQQQGQNAENASSDTQAQTTQNTQNLMDFITAFFTAFVSASATNCNLDIGLSQYGFGTIDMCSTDIPVVFSVIINIITLVMVVPMVFWLISSIISAFKEFQE